MRRNTNIDQLSRLLAIMPLRSCEHCMRDWPDKHLQQVGAWDIVVEKGVGHWSI